MANVTTAQLFEVCLFFFSSNVCRVQYLTLFSFDIYLLQCKQTATLTLALKLNTTVSHKYSAQLSWFVLSGDLYSYHLQLWIQTLPILETSTDGHSNVLKLIYLCMPLTITFGCLYIIIFVILSGTVRCWWVYWETGLENTRGRF